MEHGEFIWCDLSAYDPKTARAFYTQLFGWVWIEEDGSHLASIAHKPVASVYQMPSKFIDMGMPSFWMSYISVESANDTAATAERLGGKVELGPAVYQDRSAFALIRDPLGAGFTVIDTSPTKGATKGPGARLGHALFVSDVTAIRDFYTGLFGWSFEDIGGGIYAVHHLDKLLFYAHEIPDPAVRGQEQYWSVLFADAGGRAAIEAHRGSIISEFDLPEGHATLAFDPQKAAFMTVRAQDA